MTSPDQTQDQSPTHEPPAATHTQGQDPAEKHGVEVDPDVSSDPALDDGDAGEWADEGGATPQGPATDA